MAFMRRLSFDVTQTGVDGDPVKPGIELGSPAKRRDGPIGFEKHILGKRLHHVRILCNSVNQVIDAALVLLNKKLKSPFIPFLAPSHKHLI